jgi:predicted nucleic acid-binding protein
MIAGIAIARGATIATRNMRDFADLDIPVINPWVGIARGAGGAATRRNS